MRKYLAIALFATICAFSFGIKPLISNKILLALVSNFHYIILLFLIYKHDFKKEIFYKYLFTTLIVIHFILDFYIFFEHKFLVSAVTITIDVFFAFIYYLSFVFLFKKRGSGLYTKSKKDWLISFPIGFLTFLSFQFSFNSKIQPKYEPILILLSSFISFFVILGINTPIEKSRQYVIFCLGLFFTFVAFSLGIHIYQIQPSPYIEVVMKSLFLTGSFCLLEGFYGFLDFLEEKN